MKREDKFEKYKVTKVSTDKVVCNVYMDAFPIEKVKIQNCSYKSKDSINIYLDFPLISRLAADVTTGRLFKKIEADQYHKYNVHMGGTAKGPDGKPISRRMDLGMSGEKIFINMSEGPGKLSDTGVIMPDGQSTTKVSVPMSIDDFRELILFTHDCVNAYLAHLVNKLVRESDEDRQNNVNK